MKIDGSDEVFHEHAPEAVGCAGRGHAIHQTDILALLGVASYQAPITDVQVGHAIQNGPLKVQIDAVTTAQGFPINQNTTAANLQVCLDVPVQTSVPQERNLILPAVQHFQKKAVGSALIPMHREGQFL